MYYQWGFFMVPMLTLTSVLICHIQRPNGVAFTSNAGNLTKKHSLPILNVLSLMQHQDWESNACLLVAHQPLGYSNQFKVLMSSRYNNSNTAKIQSFSMNYKWPWNCQDNLGIRSGDHMQPLFAVKMCISVSSKNIE